MNRELFGTDGVRGIAGKWPLDRDGAVRIGKAVGSYFGKTNKTVIIACDPRRSSEQIVKNVSEGLMQTGINVVFIGVLPTPGLAYLTHIGDYAAGVMITASHNPVQYNGVKVFDSSGDKLSDEIEEKLNQLIESDTPTSGQGQMHEDTQITKDYEEFLIKNANGLSLSGMKIAIDTANGAASGVAARVFGSLGAEVTALSDKPDGQNINDNCGATHPETLAATVLSQKLDLGIALDGDADRVIMIDNLGREVKGDYIMYILAVTGKLDGVVATEMSNQGFEQSLHRHGIKVMRTKVGDRYVLDGLKESGYILGGEQSGHIIFYNLLATGDGLLAALMTVRAVAGSNKTLAEWCDEVELLPQALVNFDLPNKTDLDKTDVQAYVKQQSAELGDNGRVIIRASGTEPVGRVMVEAADADQRAAAIAEKLKELIK